MQSHTHNHTIISTSADHEQPMALMIEACVCPETHSITSELSEIWCS